MTLAWTAAVLLVVLAFAVIRPYGLPEATVAVPAAILLILVGPLDLADALAELRSIGPTVGLPRRGADARLPRPIARACSTGSRPAARRRAGPPAAAVGPRRRSGRGDHGGAEPRRHRRAAHAGRGGDGGACASRPAARLRRRAPGQLGVAAAAGVEPDQPARLRRHRAVVPALHRR